ncbi:MAG: phospho-N-acetylmuramoyl-pentapeptide-transferase [Bacteroidota bacterium]|nr:phospho-N-acetylmuramoyl-pentapeptide-transferase [Candidatus Kapabacteria bacterium]MCS7302772.1 phospho-N-acetylmuramoyl-pentapeptide-transferase [Candidatus Kapabacteria bacterium]MCX7936998.1 phospho-N-acetylmuramoyl-pentapeptide-transferase [Chlorobiota bacterium]MDW8075469.1 phospho-N-acetylmuramoyl-pentapeptide-transferase [Bacteroidota bacterium]MDW8272326.1 phospho-N-acetylmuramoyl-pentapeptide-transferase [Bacteroidota bacterium]
MLYELLLWIDRTFGPPGFGVFRYVTFRAAAAAITALSLSFLVGPRLIRVLKRRQIGEQMKAELAATGNHATKAGTPTMGGLIILLAVIVPTLLWAPVANAYIWTIVLVTLWMGAVGFLDDYLKVIRKLPHGLIARYKLVGQVIAGLAVGCTIYFFPEIFSSTYASVKTLTTVPFAKHVNFDWGIFYIPMVIFVLTATSNAVNLTDGLDGLAIGTVGIAAFALALIAYISGNAVFAQYLTIMHLRGADELTIFASALVGAALGFLWFNAYPAQVFMGDTGSLALGGAIGGLCVLIKKEFLLPILGGIFFAETLSVIIQVTYFKYTKRRYGEGRRIFRMAPLHHHFERCGWHEAKVVTRFYIIAVILAIITMATFKVR